MGTHRLPGTLLNQEVKVAVIGCGGTGSAIAGGLPRLHQTMRALGHPHGMHVTFIDGDRVSKTNTVRSAFSAGDVGALKAEVIAHRINLFYGLDWAARSSFVGRGFSSLSHDFHLVISCVDTRAARAAIQRAIGGYALRYWLDCGNNEFDGQFVLGEPMHGWNDRAKDYHPLPTVADLYPETLVPEKVAPGPSCSAAEALRAQGPFVNEVIAHGALALLARLFTKGEIDYHGQFINLATGRSFPIAVPEQTERPVPAAAVPRGARARRRAQELQAARG